MNHIQELQKMGLSEKEALVYVAALELGESPVQDISKKSGVNRATTYFVLETLIQKGLCAMLQKDKKTVYYANSPEYLDAIFNVRKKEIEEQQKQFQKLLPDLKLISNRELDKPAVKFYEGMDGVINCCNDFIKNTKPGTDEPERLVYNRDLLNQIFDEKVRARLKADRLGKKIKAKVLYTYDAGEMSTTADGERRKISSEKFPITCDLAIYDDMFRIISLGKRLTALLIKDKEVANSMKSLFDLAWEAADKK